MYKPFELRVRIRRPIRADAAPFLSAVKRSRRLHCPWVTPPSNPQAFARYLERTASDSHQGFLVIQQGTKEIVGVINLNNVIRGAFQSAFLGYYCFSPHARAGLMFQGMVLVLNHAFRVLKLHRVEANIQPRNRASIALVRKCGFVREGFSRRYLKVRGRWKDHQRWALLSEDFQPIRR